VLVRRALAIAALLAPVLAPADGGQSHAEADLRAGPHPLRDAAPEAPWLPPEPAPPVSPGHGPKTGFHPASSPREVLLTFDDGPDLKTTPLVLEELDRRGLRGIFFVVGWRLVGQKPEAMARRDLVRKIASHGHLVANHTMTHHDLCAIGREREREIDQNSELIAASSGLSPILFRSPYGAYCRDLAAALDARGLTDVGWNIDPMDWEADKTEDEVFAYLVRKLGRLEGRGIMLLHDTKPDSVHALPRILDWIERENAVARAEGRAPIKILDYTALLPPRELPTTGLEPIVTAMADLVAPLARALPAGAHP